MKGDSDHTRSGLVLVLMDAAPASTAAVACCECRLAGTRATARRDGAGAADSVEQGGENQGATRRNYFFFQIALPGSNPPDPEGCIGAS